MTKKISDYKELIVWQKSRELVGLIYTLSSNLPNSEKYGFISQMQRAVVSIPVNIAEGHSRASRKEFMQFLAIAAGSTAELETLLILAVDLKLISENSAQNAFGLILEIRKMLGALRLKLKT